MEVFQMADLKPATLSATEAKAEVKAAEAKPAEAKAETAKKETAKKETTRKTTPRKTTRKTTAKKTTAAAAKATGTKTAAKKTTTRKTSTRKASTTTTRRSSAGSELIKFEFGGKGFTTDELTKIAKDVWRYDLKKKVGDLKSIQLYVKADECKVYYIFNNDIQGSFGL
jgi:cytoskeletal protein RodZ